MIPIQLPPSTPEDPLRGLSPAEFIERVWAFAPVLSIAIVVVFLAGAYGVFLYRRGRIDEREGFRAYIDAIVSLLSKDRD